MIGAGDFVIQNIRAMPDPCPFAVMQNSTSLGKKQSLLYAPFSNVGALTFDQDAVYIDIGRADYTKKEHLSRENNNGEEGNEEDEEKENEFDPEEPAGLLKNLQDVQTGVDEKMKHSTLRIFKGSQTVSGGDMMMMMTTTTMTAHLPLPRLCPRHCGMPVEVAAAVVHSQC
jgi:ribosome biogenesis protein BMS1